MSSKYNNFGIRCISIVFGIKWIIQKKNFKFGTKYCVKMNIVLLIEDHPNGNLIHHNILFTFNYLKLLRIKKIKNST